MADPFGRKKALDEAIKWGEPEEAKPAPVEPTYQPKRKALSDTSTTSSSTTTSSTSTTQPSERKEYGVNQGDQLSSARDYLGHFAKDDVMRKGHNTGFTPHRLDTSIPAKKERLGQTLNKRVKEAYKLDSEGAIRQSEIKEFRAFLKKNPDATAQDFRKNQPVEEE